MYRLDINFDLRRYQQEYNKLQKEKFPFDEDKPHRKLIGAGEELGEVGHEFLRHELGKDVKLKMMVEIGDTINFLVAFCNILKIDITDCIIMAHNKVLNREDAANKD